MRRTEQRVRRAIGRLRRPDPVVVTGAGAIGEGTYERLYDDHARALPPEQAIGAGDFEVMGEIMLSALCAAGLAPGHTLVDLGCGTGRLAVPAVAYLDAGRYVGIDISETMLRQAQQRVASKTTASCDVRWIHQTEAAFLIEPGSVDFFAAFSVFTHMEHEDSYRYLADARRVVREGGRFVFSCLTMDLLAARSVFLTSAGVTLAPRWSAVRNVTTTYEYMDALAELAGWRGVQWYVGDEERIPLRTHPERCVALGQSICVLAA